jgi:hypothetical protein
MESKYLPTGCSPEYKCCSVFTNIKTLL